MPLNQFSILTSAHFKFAFALSLSIFCCLLCAPPLTHAAPLPAGQPLPAARNNHTATLLPNGKVLVAGGSTDGQPSGAQANAYLYDPATGLWTETARMGTARYGHFAVLLRNGKVLVAGGRNSANTALRSAELYNPATNRWEPTGSLQYPRYAATGTMISFASNVPGAPSGFVLAAGGNDGGGAINTCELYNPGSGRWRTAARLHEARFLHAAVVLPNGTILAVGGSKGSGYIDSAEIYDPVVDRWTATGDLREGRDNLSATLLSNGLVLAAGGRNGNGPRNSAELYDPLKRTWTFTQAMTAARDRCTATLLPNGRLFVAGGITGGEAATASTETFDPATQRWTAGATLNAARATHAAVLLASARVLLIGGTNTRYETTALDSVDIYDPTAGSWKTPDRAGAPRSAHTATLLSNGKVLVVGGNEGNGPTTRVELHDPAATINSWTPLNNLLVARERHTATLLNNGKVLVVGGSNRGALGTAEIYDPSTGQWQFTGLLARARAGHTATLLPSGKVLVAGGADATAELYDPNSNQWTAPSVMKAARSNHTATLLYDGRVLATGGYPVGSAVSLRTAELYNPGNNSWEFTRLPLNYGRYGHTATLLPNGKVLVVAGLRGSDLRNPQNIAGSAELFDPVAQSWTTTSTPEGRAEHTATLLPNGKVLIAGGYKLQSSQGVIVSTRVVELYDPARGAILPFTLLDNAALRTARDSHTATLLPNGQVLVSGGLNNTTTASTLVQHNELFDVGLQAVPLAAPGLAESSWAGPGKRVCLGGIRFQGLGEAASGGFQASASNYPVVQLRRLDNEQTIHLLPDIGAPGCAVRGWTNNGYGSRIVKGDAVIGSTANLHAGAALLTVFVNGVPNTRSVVIAPPGAVSGSAPVVSITGRIHTVDDAGFPAFVDLRRNGALIATKATNTNGEYIFEDVPDPTTPTTPQPTAVRGTVFNATNNLPLTSVTIRVAGSNLTTLSANNGAYLLANAPAGARSVSASAPGFQPKTIPVNVAANQTTVLNFSLAPGNCNFDLAPSNRAHTPAAATGSISVFAPTGCSWTATSNAPWLTVTSGATGAGNGAVNYTVAANTGCCTRTGTITIGNLNFTVTQSAFILTLTAGQEAEAASAEAAQQQQAVYTVTPRGTSANGHRVIFFPPVITVTFGGLELRTASAIRAAAAPNAGGNNDACAQTTDSNRITGQLTALNNGAGVSVPLTITNQRAECNLPPTTLAILNGDAFDRLGLALYGDYVIAPESRNVVFVAPDGNSRRTVLQLDGLAAGQDFATQPAGSCPALPVPNVTQMGCENRSLTLTTAALLGVSYSWSGPNGRNFVGPGPHVFAATAADSGVYTLTATANGCSRAVNVNVSVNVFAFAFSEAFFTVDGGESSVQVSPPADSCNWVVTNNDPNWITIKAGGSGGGRGTVTYSVARNQDGEPRSGSLQIGGAVFIITQAGTQ